MWANCVTLTLDLTHDFDLRFSRLNFEIDLYEEWEGQLIWNKRDVSWNNVGSWSVTRVWAWNLKNVPQQFLENGVLYWKLVLKQYWLYSKIKESDVRPTSFGDVGFCLENWGENTDVCVNANPAQSVILDYDLKFSMSIFLNSCISGMGGPNDMEQKECELMGYLTSLRHDLEFGWNSCISGMEGSVDMEWNGWESVGCWTHYVTLTLDFQGQNLKLLYLRWLTWNEMNVSWWDVGPTMWHWTWIFKVKFWISCFGEMASLINMNWKWCKSIGC